MDYEEKVVDFYFNCELGPGVIVNFGPNILRIFSYMNCMVARCIADISYNLRGVCMYVCLYVCCISDIAGNC
jgi:hypothetical protein